MRAIVPIEPDLPEARTVTFDQDVFRVLADRGTAVIIEFHSLSPAVEWFEEFDPVYCERQHEPDVVVAIRKATDEDLRTHRVPVWIQDEKIPECCGRPMFFVGQIDDSVICTEPPPEAEMWWHDAASFYVFTCPYCLGVKAVGQQF